MPIPHPQKPLPRKLLGWIQRTTRPMAASPRRRSVCSWTRRSSAIPRCPRRWLCPQRAGQGHAAEAASPGLPPQLRGVQEASADAFFCIKWQNSLNLRLQEPWGEVRPDLRFRRQLLAPGRHALRVQRLQRTPLTPLLSAVFGPSRLWRDTFGQFHKFPGLLAPHICRTVVTSIPHSASHWPQGPKENRALFFFFLTKRKLLICFFISTQYLHPSLAQPPTSTGWLRWRERPALPRKFARERNVMKRWGIAAGVLAPAPGTRHHSGHRAPDSCDGASAAHLPLTWGAARRGELWVCSSRERAGNASLERFRTPRDC